METWTPAGKIKFPSFVSSWTIRLRTIIGGYSLKTSYKIMVTCDMEYIYIVRIRKWCAYQTHLIKYLIEVMPMQKNWLQWSFSFWKKFIQVNGWIFELLIWVLITIILLTFLYLHKTRKTHKKHCKTQKMHKKHIGSNLIENLKIFGGLIVIQFFNLLSHHYKIVVVYFPQSDK